MTALEALQKQIKEDFIRAQLGDGDGVEIDANIRIFMSFGYGHWVQYKRPRGLMHIQRYEYFHPADSDVITEATTTYRDVVLGLNDVRKMVRDIDKMWRASFEG